MTILVDKLIEMLERKKTDSYLGWNESQSEAYNAGIDICISMVKRYLQTVYYKGNISKHDGYYINMLGEEV